MSYTEIRQREGLPFGGMPYDAIVRKLEETDPDLVAEVRGYDSAYDPADAHQQYVRSEIIDWSPDPVFMESDHPRRDSALSRSQLNLRYNATRGSRPELPRHPELFYGFTGNDPRGLDSAPRFDQTRGFMTSKAAELEVRFQDSDDNQIPEEPWTNQAISFAHKAIQKRAQQALKVFSTQREGRPYARNVVLEPNKLRVRLENAAAADEGLDAIGRARFFGGDLCMANDAGQISFSQQALKSPVSVFSQHDANLGNTRGVDRMARGVVPEDNKVWRKTKHDTSFAAHKNNQHYKGLVLSERAAFAPRYAQNDHKIQRQHQAARVARNIQYADMLAAQHKIQNEHKHGVSAVNSSYTHHELKNSSQLKYKQGGMQQYKPTYDSEKAMRTARTSADVQRVAHKTNANVRGQSQTNINFSGLMPGHDYGQIPHKSAAHMIADTSVNRNPGHIIQGHDFGKVANKSDVRLRARDDASVSYAQLAPPQPIAGATFIVAEPSQWRVAAETPGVVTSVKPRWHSATQGRTQRDGVNLAPDIVASGRACAGAQKIRRAGVNSKDGAPAAFASGA